MNNPLTTLSQACSGSPTRPAILDVPLWATGLAYWTLIVMSFALALFGAEPHRPVTMTGEAAVNRLGDVVSWDAEQATGRATKDMLFRDFFACVPASKRHEAREMFVATVNDANGVQRMHDLHWYEDGAAYSVRFRRAGDAYLVTITRRR